MKIIPFPEDRVIKALVIAEVRLQNKHGRTHIEIDNKNQQFVITSEYDKMEFKVSVQDLIRKADNLCRKYRDLSDEWMNRRNRFSKWKF